MVSAELLVHFELPALGVQTRLKFKAASANLERISGVLAEWVEDLAQELKEDLLLVDNDGMEPMLQHLRKSAAAQLSAWEERLAGAQEMKLKGERAVHHMKAMREAFFKELNHNREQLYQKKKADEHHQPFTPDDVVHFDPTEYVVDDEVSQLLHQKLTLMQADHQREVNHLRERLATLGEQLRTKGLHLSAKDKWLDQVMEEHKAAQALEQAEEAFARMTSTSTTAEELFPRGPSQGGSRYDTLPDDFRAADSRDAAVGPDAGEPPWGPPDCCSSSAQCDIDSLLIQRATQLLESEAEAKWRGLLGREQGEQEEEQSDAESEASSSSSSQGSEPLPPVHDLALHRRSTVFEAPPLFAERGDPGETVPSEAPGHPELPAAAEAKLQAPEAAACVPAEPGPCHMVDAATQYEPEVSASGAGDLTPARTVRSDRQALTQSSVSEPNSGQPVPRMNIEEILARRGVRCVVPPTAGRTPTPPAAGHPGLAPQVRRRRAGLDVVDAGPSAAATSPLAAGVDREQREEAMPAATRQPSQEAHIRRERLGTLRRRKTDQSPPPPSLAAASRSSTVELGCVKMSGWCPARGPRRQEQAGSVGEPPVVLHCAREAAERPASRESPRARVAQDSLHVIDPLVNFSDDGTEIHSKAQVAEGLGVIKKLRRRCTRTLSGHNPEQLATMAGGAGVRAHLDLAEDCGVSMRFASAGSTASASGLERAPRQLPALPGMTPRAAD